MKRTELAGYCGIRKSSVTSLVDELLSQNWIRSEDKSKPRSPLKMDETYHYVLSVELDARCIRLANVNLDGVLDDLVTHHLQEDISKDHLIELLISYVKDYRASREDLGLLGITVAVPGVVDSVNGICFKYA